MNLVHHMISQEYNYQWDLSRLVTNLLSLVVIGTVVEIQRFKFVAWSRKTMWSNGHVILWSSTCHQHFINFPRCTCLQNLVVIGLMEMDISILREKENSLAPVCHFERFLKPRTPIYNSEVLDPTSRKTKRRRRTQTITMRYVFCANTKKKMLWI